MENGDKNKEIKILLVCLRGQYLAAASCRVESGRKRWGQYLAGSSLEGVWEGLAKQRSQKLTSESGRAKIGTTFLHFPLSLRCSPRLFHTSCSDLIEVTVYLDVGSRNEQRNWCILLRVPVCFDLVRRRWLACSANSASSALLSILVANARQLS